MMMMKQIISPELPYVERSHSLSDMSVHDNLSKGGRSDKKKINDIFITVFQNKCKGCVHQGTHIAPKYDKMINHIQMPRDITAMYSKGL